jgi:hypothetical protein
MGGRSREMRIAISDLRKSGQITLLMGTHAYRCNVHGMDIPASKIGLHVSRRHEVPEVMP